MRAAEPTIHDDDLASRLGDVVARGESPHDSDYDRRAAHQRRAEVRRQQTFQPCPVSPDLPERKNDSREAGEQKENHFGWARFDRKYRPEESRTSSAGLLNDGLRQFASHLFNSRRFSFFHVALHDVLNAMLKPRSLDPLAALHLAQ